MLRYILFPMLMIFIIGCGRQDTQDNTQQTAQVNRQDSIEQKNKEMVTRLFEEVINNKNVNLINELYVEDAVDHSAWPGQPPGRAGLIQSVNDFLKSYSSLRVKVDEVIAKDDKVITRESWSGVSNATNEADSGTVMHIFRIKDGKVTDEWSEGWEWLQ